MRDKHTGNQGNRAQGTLNSPILRRCQLRTREELGNQILPFTLPETPGFRSYPLGPPKTSMSAYLSHRRLWAVQLPISGTHGPNHSIGPVHQCWSGSVFADIPDTRGVCLLC